MMKKTILLLLAAFCGVLTVAAQDLIIKADASKVEAKVTEITPESVRYKRFSNPDGPTYVLPVSEISYIQYANGEKEYFKAAASIPATPLTPAIPAEEPAKVSAAPAAAEAPAASPADGVKYVVKEYEIGEFYNQDGIKGVVCMLSDDRQHGLVISLDEIYLHWSEFRKPDLRVIGTDNRSDGSVNMEKVAAYIAENNLSWDDFPAFKCSPISSCSSFNIFNTCAWIETSSAEIGSSQITNSGSTANALAIPILCFADIPAYGINFPKN